MTDRKRKIKRCLILANGKKPSKRSLNYFIRKGFEYLICADGGADSAYKMKLNPDLIIGDLDSISAKIYKFFSGKTQIVHYKKQNNTDVEKALKYALRKGYKEAVLCGATGDRLDHTFCNIGVVLKFADKIKIYLHHENSVLYAIEGKSEIKTIPGETISVYGINDKTRFTSRGLKYPLKEFQLPFGIRESTSNLATGSKVYINCSRGRGLIIRDFNVIMKHDHLFES